MARVPTSYDVALTPLDGAGVPLHRQLYLRLRDAVLSGRIPPGSRLPSSRGLAAQLGLSRNTVVCALEQLAAEGVLDLRRGSGAYVALHLAGTSPRAGRASVLEPGPTARAVLAMRPLLAHAAVRPFRPSVPALDHFPVRTWARLTASAWRAASRESLSYGDPRGCRALREALASYLRLARGVVCEPDQILVVSGAQEAIYLAALALLRRSDTAAVEDPLHPGARWALTAAGARLVSVPVDEDGFSVPAARRRGLRPRLVYVTPSNQAPLAVTMPFRRRQELLQWAEDVGACILEDDYDSEFRYVSRPIPALQGLDASARVIYIGTFSKVLAPALRIGYMVVPPPLVDALVGLRTATNLHPPTLDHLVAARFIAGGHFARHLRRMRGLYAARRTAMLAAAQSHLSGILTVQPPDAGLHVIGWLGKGSAARAVSEIRAHGMEAARLTWRPPGGPVRHGLILGFGAYDPHEIESGVRRLREILEADPPADGKVDLVRRAGRHDDSAGRGPARSRSGSDE